MKYTEKTSGEQIKAPPKCTARKYLGNRRRGGGMIRRDSIQVGDTVLIKSLICKYPQPATVKEISRSGVYVDDGSCCGTILVEWHECWYDTKENRKMIVNQKHY